MFASLNPHRTVFAAGEGRTVDVPGSVSRYTGSYEVYVEPIWGPGYATAPVAVDLP
jgi:DNA/RNA endonuclease YhcR with UshA esterase domain